MISLFVMNHTFSSIVHATWLSMPSSLELTSLPVRLTLLGNNFIHYQRRHEGGVEVDEASDSGLHERLSAFEIKIVHKQVHLT